MDDESSERKMVKWNQEKNDCYQADEVKQEVDSRDIVMNIESSNLYPAMKKTDLGRRRTGMAGESENNRLMKTSKNGEWMLCNRELQTGVGYFYIGCADEKNSGIRVGDGVLLESRYVH